MTSAAGTRQSSSKPARKSPRLGLRLTSRGRWVVFILIIALAGYLLLVSPARTYLQQRQQMREATSRYQVLADANKQMNDRVQQLQSDQTIEQLARQRYELVPPGTQEYAVMPPADPAPSDQTQKPHKNKGLWSRISNDLNPWH